MMKHRAQSRDNIRFDKQENYVLISHLSVFVNIISFMDTNYLVLGRCANLHDCV